MLNAIAACWPDAKVYPCAHHLKTNVEDILNEGRLDDRRRLIVRAFHDGVPGSTVVDSVGWSPLTTDKQQHSQDGNTAEPKKPVELDAKNTRVAMIGQNVRQETRGDTQQAPNDEHGG